MEGTAADSNLADANPIDANSNDADYNGSNNGGGLTNSIRNATSNLLQRLEAPRDRVIEFIKPAVKSDFSRNVTNVLNSIWSRVQGSNSSIVQNSLVKNSIIIPINTTLSKLREITAAEQSNSNSPDLDVIDLNRPDAEHQPFLESPSNEAAEAVSNRGGVIFLIKDDEKEDNQPAASEENSEQTLPNSQPADQPEDKHDEVRNNDLKDENDDQRTVEERPNRVESSVVRPDDTLNPTKSLRRRARFIDNHYTMLSATRVRSLFDNVQRNGMQECLASALCEANCRPQL